MLSIANNLLTRRKTMTYRTVEKKVQGWMTFILITALVLSLFYVEDAEARNKGYSLVVDPPEDDHLEPVVPYEQEFRLNVNLFSRHTSPIPESEDLDQYNSDNFGLGAQWHFMKEFYLTAGYYDNSFDKKAYYIGAGNVIIDSQFLEMGLELAVASGYEDMESFKIHGDKVVIPAGFINVKFTEQHSVKVLYNFAFLAMQYQFNFKGIGD
jgi:hypothetical protein